MATISVDIESAARLICLAHGGQVVWRVTRDPLFDPTTCPSIRLKRLRDLTRPKHVFISASAFIRHASAPLRAIPPRT